VKVVTSLLGSALRDLRKCWQVLAVTDIAFKLLAFVVLTPLAGLLFRVLLAAAGNSVLCDLDILYFFLGPRGWLLLIFVGAAWLGIVALEQASLLAILRARSANQRLGLLAALRFVSANAWPVMRVTARMVAFTLLVMAPFLVAAAAVYATLLTDYDINYYLKERPRVFQVALGIGAMLAVALTVLLLRLFTGWFFALPLVLFEGASASQALPLSCQRVRGHRAAVLAWIAGWFLFVTALSALATGMVGAAAQWVLPESTGSLRLVAVVVGMTVLVWMLVSLAINVLSTTTFAAMLFNLYRGPGGGDTAASRHEAWETDSEARGFRIGQGRLVAAAAAGVLAAAAIGAGLLYSVSLEDRVQIMAHRGSSSAAPENTLAAVRKAIQDGADWVEIDVQETADGEVVVLHDSDFMKLAGSDLKIWDATLEDLKDIDVGSWFAPEFNNERVPTLAEVLDECRGKIRVNIELKYYGHDERLEERVASIVESRGMAANVMLMSLKIDGVRKMKALRPGWKVGLLMSVSAGDIRKMNADFLAVNAGFAHRRVIRAAHESGKQIYVWTVNDARTMSTMISRGVDGLLTDKPALARSVLEQRARMSAPERLLLELAGMLGAVPDLGEP
jgi:glycerophosphoryl diester phosphodiesterase